MIHRLSNIIADFLLKLNVINKDEFDIYVYGYEAIISGAIDLFITLIIGIIFNQFFNACLFFIIFATVRIYTGGYHADTYLKCKSIFILINIAVLTISQLEFIQYLIIPISILFVLTTIFLAPIENSNKPLTPPEKRKYHKISVIYALILSIANMVIYFLKISTSHIIITTMFFIMLLMLVELLTKKGGESNEEGYR